MKSTHTQLSVDEMASKLSAFDSLQLVLPGWLADHAVITTSLTHHQHFGSVDSS
jgi:hypothetical protein